MADQKFFFLHIMKTAGWTLRRHIMFNFQPEQVYPCDHLDANMLTANFSIDYLANLPAERRAEIRVFTGHFPYVAVELLGEDLTTITILRDPVERTLSYLRQRQSIHGKGADLSLEEIYEDQFLFPALIHDHQAKLFALSIEDAPESYMHELDIDSGRLATAKQNLERVDVIGTQDRFDDLLSDLEERFGWRRDSRRDWNVGPGAPEGVPASFRRRIAEDNQADMELFEHARKLCERGRRAETVR